MSDKKHIEEAIRKAVRGILSEMMTEDDAMDGSPDGSPAKKKRANITSMSDDEFDSFLANARDSVELSADDEERLTGGIDPAGVGAPFKSKHMRDADPLDQHLGLADTGEPEEPEEEEEVSDKELKGKGYTFTKGARELSQDEVGEKLGVTQQRVRDMEVSAKNKFSNRAAYLDDVLSDGADEEELLLKYIQQVPEKQRRALVDEFKTESQPDVFVNDYIDVLLQSNDGSEDDLSPQEVAAMRSKPDWVMDSPQYKSYAAKMNSDMRALLSSSAFYDHVRSKTNFQNFVNDLVQKSKTDRGITDDTKDNAAKAGKGDFAKFMNKFGSGDIDAAQLDEPEAVDKLHKARKAARAKDVD